MEIRRIFFNTLQYGGHCSILGLDAVELDGIKEQAYKVRAELEQLYNVPLRALLVSGQLLSEKHEQVRRVSRCDT